MLGGTTQHTDDLAGSLGLSCVLGTRWEVTRTATPATEVQHVDHRNASDRNVLHRPWHKLSCLACNPTKAALAGAINLAIDGLIPTMKPTNGVTRQAEGDIRQR